MTIRSRFFQPVTRELPYLLPAITNIHFRKIGNVDKRSIDDLSQDKTKINDPA